MNTPFQIGTDQLHRLDEQQRLMQTIAEATGEPIVVAGAEVLEEAKLESYLELCELVDEDSDLTRFCVNALGRVELVLYVIDRQNKKTLALAAAEPLGQLTAKALTEEAELTAFFDLFAPDEEAYRAYKHRRELLADEEDLTFPPQATEENNLSTQQVGDETGEPAVEADAEVIEPEHGATATVDAQLTGEAAPEALEPAEELESKRVASRVLVNGEEVDLVRTAAVMLQIMQEHGGKSIKSNVFLNDQRFLAAVRATTRKGSKRQDPTGRIANSFTLLDKKFPGITYKSGPKVGTGAMRNLSDDYTLEFIFDDDNSKPGELPETTQAEAVGVTSTTIEVEGVTVGAEREAHEDIALPAPDADSIFGRFADIKARAETDKTYESKPQMTSSTKLVAGGYMIDGKRTDFTDTEYLLVGAINNSPRKAPLTPGNLADVLRTQNGSGNLSAEQVDTILADLGSRLPEGWLVKVAGSRPDQPSGWRFASRIGVKQQSHKAKKGTKA